jgi:biopolymer transport protein ExbD
MRFKNQQNSSQMPEVNLIPMLDLMMAVLTFFILVAMTLNVEPRGVDVQLPSKEDATAQQPANTPAPMIVKFSPQGTIAIADRPLSGQEQLMQEIQGYLGQNQKGVVLLVADPEANYEQVIRLLAAMRDVGGKQVSLGLEAD